jgi:hypothetical protein
MDTHSIEKRQRTRVGALALIGLGSAMLLYQITPHAVHGALTLATFGLVFGAVYALGGARYGWAKVPALVFSILAAIVFFTSLGEPMHMWWPLWLVVAGLWIMRPRHRWAR